MTSAGGRPIDLTEAEIDTFMKRSGVTEGCWQWAGPFDKGGYGRLMTAARGPMLAHRIAWTVLRGAIPAGECVLHRCDNRRCVNPEHLFLGSQAVNVADMVEKGRDGDHRGERNGRAKLTAEQAIEIRRAPKGGRHLAELYGVSYALVKMIRRGEVWSHV